MSEVTKTVYPCDNCENETLRTMFCKALGWNCKECQVECPCSGCEEDER